MKAKALTIFRYIEHDDFEEQDKLQAIKEVLALPTHNSITKDQILYAFRWFFDWAIQEVPEKPTNADRIREMDDEELARFLCKVKADYQWVGQEFPKEDECGEWEEWLRSETYMPKGDANR